ncbi:4-hydroxythreonine-4-phosphate dehydrogenase PdxA [Kangiella shandongensis]|uniref:4-hydroxythreonine-4-phosphate dehydrogenase PdxA n=1 Tax=Kangiella shandongensis TaxID=2763258 RepID=UPI001CBE034B|nr:4-hydroxythreonine-4-phosphate dehydrogenase PdxA [Kangiella shandongensis]
MDIARILITAGEPAGIGPELVAKLAQAPCSDQIIVCAAPELLNKAAKSTGLPLELTEFDPQAEPTPHRPGHLWLIPHELDSDGVHFGQLNVEHAPYVLATLQTANDMAQNGSVDAILTGPVHKGIINDSGLHFSGHTEFFADRSGCDKVVMMLATEGLRVALATTHLPLQDVSKTITSELLTQVITIVDAELRQKFAIKRPKILVCGLNPHAGENGHLGSEEQEVIEPTLATLRQQLEAELIGPLPADTAFQPNKIADVDTVLAMYHDQGLPTLKYKGFGKAVNVTLGLPYIRTSVDHGTGLDIAGQSIADTGSMQYALQFTQDLIQRRKQSHGSL